MRRARADLAVATAVLVGIAGCASQTSSAAAGFDADAFAERWAEAEGGGLDYQLGGAFEPSAGVTVVVRDRAAPPAGAMIDVCYVNAFQTQPGELAWWTSEHPEVLLRGADGALVGDPAWPDERILDTSTAASRATVAEIVGGWIDGCASAGFEAVELDNLDSWTRADGLTADGNLELAALLVARAHAAGLAVAQKNALEARAAGPAAGFDLVVTEDCARFDECDDYGALYERHLAVEYADALPAGTTFADLCAGSDLPPLAVLRDVELATPGEPGHVAERC